IANSELLKQTEVQKSLVARCENVLRFPLGKVSGQARSPAPWTHPLWVEIGATAMPRPLKEDPRDRFKTFRFTEAELARLEARARASGHTLSSYARMRLLDGHADGASGEGAPESEVRGQDGRPIVLPGGVAARRTTEAIRRLAEEMRRVGVNLNQIA